MCRMLVFSFCSLWWCSLGLAAEAHPGRADWLVTEGGAAVEVRASADKKTLTMTNGLIRRTWRLEPNGATVGFENLMTGEAILRGVKPEARVEIDGKTYDVGGLNGQPNYAFLREEWVEKLTGDPKAFQFVDYRVEPIKARFAWKRKRYAANAVWPPVGQGLVLRFGPPKDAPEGLTGISVEVHYEMYAGMPLLSKWLTVRNGGDRGVRLTGFTSEILAVVEAESVVDGTRGWRYPNLHVESDYAFHGMSPGSASEVVHWVADPQYMTQVNYARTTPCLLETRPRLGPDAEIGAGETFASFRIFELVHDSTDRERQGLAIRRMYRAIAPWVTENPILMHVRSAKPEAVRFAIDQCSAVGFEMVILTFGSGFNIEDERAGTIEKWKGLADYAHSRGIELGGYSLLASRRIDDADDVVNPKTGKPGGFATFGNSPCLGSKWGQDYFRKLYAFFEKTGFDLLEHDGSYPGDVCASTAHPGHRGLADSQWTQWRTITDFYKWCVGRGVYLNVPDWYFLNGSTKTGMGYRETNWSLPRAQQIIHGRQNIFDGTWEKSPSMGWMFVPLVEYQGGGAVATIEPLSEHLDTYEAILAQNFCSGVQACYRGPRLYDTDKTKAVVKKWVDVYKKYRAILDSDIVHIRRPDGRDWDAILHVNPKLETKGLLVIWNPLDREIRRQVRVPLYYTGLTKTAEIRLKDGAGTQHDLDRDYGVDLPVQLPAHSMTWFTIR